MCILALADEARRQVLAKAGQQRLNRNGQFNQKQMQLVIDSVDFSKKSIQSTSLDFKKTAFLKMVS
jgi:hypothetical protein